MKTRAFDTGVYPNYLAEAGIGDEEARAMVHKAFETIFFDEQENFCHHTDEDAWCMVDTGNIDARTEGMSYGMMMCVQMDRKDIFDKLWTFSERYMLMKEGPCEGYFRWSVHIDGSSNSNGPAPDGEEYYAMALFMAAARWGDGEGSFNYSARAREILRHAVHQHEMVQGGQPMWEPENTYIRFVPGMKISDPSYHLPHFYELFALWADEEDRAFFAEAAKASRAYLAKACHQETGLSAEYALFDGSPQTEKLPWGYFGNFYSDAYRTAANIGLDAEWFHKDAGHYAAPLRIMKFFGTPLEAARCVFETNGTPVDKTVLHPYGLLATIAQGALAVDPETASAEDLAIARQWVSWFWEQPLRKGVRRYYDNCLAIFAYLALSGSYRIW